MSFVYGCPIHEIKQRLTSAEVTLLQAAYNQGVLPDPWLQTAMLCSVFSGQKMSEFRLQPARTDTAEQLLAGFEARRGENSYR